jgi:Xaa-Pro aminopeptidase
VADARPARLAALAASLEAARLDGVLLTSLPNIRYLTGFSGSSALAFVTARAEVVFVTDFRYKTQVVDEVGEIARVSVEAQSLWSGLWQLLTHYPHVEVAGFESAELRHRDFARLLEQGERWQWRPTTELVEALRER